MHANEDGDAAPPTIPIFLDGGSPGSRCSVEGSYLRSDAFENRREKMEACRTCFSAEPPNGNNEISTGARLTTGGCNLDGPRPFWL